MPAVDFRSLQSQYPDVRGWLTIQESGIDYPVLQSSPEEPEYYLPRDYRGNYDINGSLFLQTDCILGESKNLTIYGHNMKNGTMFSDLKKYLNTDFLNSHRTVRLETADGVFLFTVTEVRRTNTADPWYDRTTCEDGRRLILSTCYGSGKDGRLLIIAEE